MEISHFLEKASQPAIPGIFVNRSKMNFNFQLKQKCFQRYLKEKGVQLYPEDFKNGTVNFFLILNFDK